MKPSKRIDLLAQMRANAKRSTSPPTADRLREESEKARLARDMDAAYEILDALERPTESRLRVDVVRPSNRIVTASDQCLIAAAAACVKVLDAARIEAVDVAVDAMAPLCDTATAEAALLNAGAAHAASLEYRMDEVAKLHRHERESALRAAIRTMRSVGPINVPLASHIADCMGLTAALYLVEP